MLQVKNIYKEYKTGALVQRALDGVSLNLRDNEFVAILGPSGSGKTTLLNIIGGLDRYDKGDLIINGISTKKYKDRDWDSYRNHTIGFVFQSYNLIPHQTVLANVELALTISGISKSERKERAQKALEQVGLGDQGHKKPNQMSGGQMQRVAIARALVNDPDILLADEPTGALDSDTSVQVMDLLKDVAKDRLVVMVTHNPELANKYATRIVELRDGQIRNDTDPFEVDIKQEIRHENMGKSSMSFLTALSLSFNNLKTKKARTILTSFAGSIGIIGIAAILSLSNGVNQYIKDVEEETLSEYPLQIQESGFDMSSMINEVAQEREKEKNDKSDIRVVQMITNMFSTIGSNDLSSLKAYFDSGESQINQYVNAIEYSYNVSPQIYSANTNKVRKVHPDTSFASLGIGSGSSSNSLMSMAMSTDVFYQMPSDPKLYQEQYAVKAGRWPENYNECVLILSRNGGISDFLLYTLDLRDPKELDEMIKQFSNNEEVDTPDDIHSYSYDDILGIKFKLVNSCDYYTYDEKYDVYIDKTDDKKYMKNLVKNGEDMTIVGIVQPDENANVTMLMSGIGYPSSLTTHVIKEAGKSDIVKKQLSNHNKNVFTGKSFDDEEKNDDFDLNSLFSIDEQKLKSAFSFDQSKLSIDPNAFDLSNVQIDTSSLPQLDLSDIMDDIEVNFTPEQIEKLTTSLSDDLTQYTMEHPTLAVDPNVLFASYMQERQDFIQQQLMSLLQESGLLNQFEVALQKRLEAMMGQYMQAMTTAIQQQLTTAMGQQMSNMSSSFQDAFHVDAKKFAEAIQVNMDQEELSQLMISLMTTEKSSYDSNIQKLGYADFEEPNQISIYPTDFDNKQRVIDILDSYNERMEKEDEDKVISYTDYVGALMSSVTDIIDMISYVLIAFVAISLVVSSIMIGVITYISVLERKKEIGILRAIGASKSNISQVFNAETFIIGLLAGLFGIGITLLLLIPGNMLIHHLSGNNDLNAALPAVAGIILIVLSVILTLIGGIIPSRKAAQEDPVTALRTE